MPFHPPALWGCRLLADGGTTHDVKVRARKVFQDEPEEPEILTKRRAQNRSWSYSTAARVMLLHILVLQPHTCGTYCMSTCCSNSSLPAIWKLHQKRQPARRSKGKTYPGGPCFRCLRAPGQLFYGEVKARPAALFCRSRFQLGAFSDRPATISGRDNGSGTARGSRFRTLNSVATAAWDQLVCLAAGPRFKRR